MQKEKFLRFLQEKVYPKMPVRLQNIGISIFGLYWYRHRFGGEFKQHLKSFKSREFSAKADWDAYQKIKLRALMLHAFKNVPYYHELFKHQGLNQRDLENFELKDLQCIPFLEKETLRELGTTDLLSRKLRKGSFISSSGSTGTPVKIYLPQYFHQKWSALMETRVRNWAGVTCDTPRGMIGGRRVIPDFEAKYPLYRYNYVEKQTYFSAYHLSSATVGNYITGLYENKVEFLTGYAVSIFLMAKFALEQNIKSPTLKAVITSSEKLTVEMRTTIEKVFQCKVFDSYSGCEACGLISETPEGKMVFNPDSGILELLDTDLNAIFPGNTGEIVLTGLHNFDQPLIRYRIGDYAKLDGDQTLSCGRDMPVIACIEGRIEDKIQGEDGRVMVRFHSVFYNITGLKLSQIIQESTSLIIVNLVVDHENYNRVPSEKLIVGRIQSQLGVLAVQFLYPEKIAMSKNGKFKSIISNLKFA